MVLVADRHRDRIGGLGLASQAARGFCRWRWSDDQRFGYGSSCWIEPNLKCAFNRRSLSAHGSAARSAWLTEPFLRRPAASNQPRTAQQLAEQALDNLGWTLDWQL